MTALLDPDEVCRITNETDTVIRITFEGQDYIFPPHKEVVAPSDVAILGWGDPRSGPEIGKWKHRRLGEGFIPPRSGEVFRLRQKWGNATQAMDDSMNRRPSAFGDETKVFAPKITVKTLQGEIVTMVADDPEGTTSLTPMELTTEQQSMRAMMEKLQADYELLQRTMNTGQDTVVTSEDELPEDTADMISREPAHITAHPPSDSAFGFVDADA